MESWDEALDPLIKGAKEKGWAYDVQGSIHLGCYAGEGPMLHGGHVAFLGALGSVGDLDEDYAIARMIDAMSIPLAPPIFNRPLPGEAIFDLLFGRMNVCLAVNIPQLIEDCEMDGIDVRFATRRELASARRFGAGPVLYKGKGLYFRLGENSMMLMEGVILRALFLGERPESVIRGFLKNQDAVNDLASGVG